MYIKNYKLTRNSKSYKTKGKILGIQKSVINQKACVMFAIVIFINNNLMHPEDFWSKDYFT